MIASKRYLHYWPCLAMFMKPLQWRHNGHVGFSNHQPHHLFRPKSKKTSCSASLAFVWGIHRWPVNYPHKWPVTRKMFPFDDVIMRCFFQVLPNSVNVKTVIFFRIGQVVTGWMYIMLRKKWRQILRYIKQMILNSTEVYFGYNGWFREIN